MHSATFEVIKNILAVIGGCCVLSTLVIFFFCAVAYLKKD
jgi:hypothetical protein